MYATAAKPLFHKAFSPRTATIYGYAPKAEKMHRSVHIVKWSLCDCIHLLKLVDIKASVLIQNHNPATGLKVA